MKIYDTIVSRRTIRKFKQIEIPVYILKKLTDAGRLAPSAMNLQPLEYFIATDKQLRDKIFNTLIWAKYISPEGTPKEGEEPAAYIIVIFNNDLANESLVKYDAGASIENMIIAALEEGIGCCWLKSFDKIRLTEILEISGDYSIDSVLALGYPLENPVSEDIEKDCSIKYYKDTSGRLHVPKRKLCDIIHVDKF